MTTATLDWYDEPRPKGPVRLKPGWLRPVAAVLIIAVHLGVLATWARQQPPVTALDAIDVSMVSLGDNVVESAAAPAPAAEDTPPETETTPPPPQVMQAEAAPDVTAPAPIQEAPDALAVPLEREKPAALVQPETPAPAKPREPVKAEVKPRPDEARRDEMRRKHAEEAHKAHQRAAAATAAEAKAGARAQRAGVAEGRPQAPAMSAASYGALIMAQIQAHKFFPSDARAAGISGSVGVTFSVAPSGTISNASVTRSSGSGSLDSAARQIVFAVHAPPPPNGTFHGSTNIVFAFR